MKSQKMSKHAMPMPKHKMPSAKAMADAHNQQHGGAKVVRKK